MSIVECFSVDKARTACQFFDEGCLKVPPSMEFLLEDTDKGRSFLRSRRILWSALGFVCGWKGLFGWCATAFTTSRLFRLIALGGHLRSGLEDTLKFGDGRL